MQKLFTSRPKASTNFPRDKGRPIFIESNTTTCEGSSYFLKRKHENKPLRVKREKLCYFILLVKDQHKNKRWLICLSNSLDGSLFNEDR